MVNLSKSVWLLTALLSLAGHSFAQMIFYDPAWHFAEKQKTISIILDDQITDGCWPNPLSTKNQMERFFTRNGFEIEEEWNGISEAAVLFGLGYAEADGSCSVTIGLSILSLDTRQITNDADEISALYNSILWQSSYVLTGPTFNINSRISSAFEELAQSFLTQLSENARLVRKEIVDVAPSDRKRSWRQFLAD
jgi:hypothetical protein